MDAVCSGKRAFPADLTRFLRNCCLPSTSSVLAGPWPVHVSYCPAPVKGSSHSSRTIDAGSFTNIGTAALCIVVDRSQRATYCRAYDLKALVRAAVAGGDGDTAAAASVGGGSARAGAAGQEAGPGLRRGGQGNHSGGPLGFNTARSSTGGVLGTGRAADIRPESVYRNDAIVPVLAEMQLYCELRPWPLTPTFLCIETDDGTLGFAFNNQADAESCISALGVHTPAAASLRAEAQGLPMSSAAGVPTTGVVGGPAGAASASLAPPLGTTIVNASATAPTTSSKSRRAAPMPVPPPAQQQHAASSVVSAPFPSSAADAGTIRTTTSTSGGFLAAASSILVGGDGIQKQTSTGSNDGRKEKTGGGIGGFFGRIFKGHKSKSDSSGAGDVSGGGKATELVIGDVIPGTFKHEGHIGFSSDLSGAAAGATGAAAALMDVHDLPPEVKEYLKSLGEYFGDGAADDTTDCDSIVLIDRAL